MQRTRRTGLLAGAVALLLQIVAWAWMPAVIATANAAETEAKTGRIVICTPDGFKTIVLDDRGTPVDPDSGQTTPAMSGESCPLCPLIGGLALPPPELRVMPATARHHGPEALPGDRIAAGWFLSTLQARAPPALG